MPSSSVPVARSSAGTTPATTGLPPGPFLLDNPVRHYDWGGREAIPRLLGQEPDGRPHAELWIGAHPQDSSVAVDGDVEVPLDLLVSANTVELLGAEVADRFGRLPFLLKMLSADRALSLQVHPTSEHAAARFDDERDLPADERAYTDPFHKPEMVLAVTPFEALCGIRPPAEVLAEAADLGLRDPVWDRATAALAGADCATAVMDALVELLAARGTPSATALVAAVRAATSASGTAHHRAVTALADAHPDDPGVAVALLLHHVVLLPGEALFVAPGVPHAYLGGEAVEVMAASDNVLRAGLTSKTVDVAELLEILDPAPAPLPRVEREVDGALSRYRPADVEFELTVVDLAAAEEAALPQLDGPRVVLALDGSATVCAHGDVLDLDAGRACFVGSDLGEVGIVAGPGGGTFVCATSPR